MFSGVYTAIVTPFGENGVDHDALKALIELQIEGGVDGVVPCGTTGESSTLSDEEILQVIETTIQVVDGRCKVIAGVGTNNTARTIELAQAAYELGADAGLVITPYYNKPTQAGLFAHFSAVADAVPNLPIVMYNVPSRTGVSLELETIVRLSKRPEIVALKEATADMDFAARIAAACGDHLTLLSGDDATALTMWSVGGKGVISVSSNLLPAQMKALWNAFSANDSERARSLNHRLIPLFEGLFIETNPVPVKVLVSRNTGLFDGRVRLPLVDLEPESLHRLETICHRLEIPLNP